MLRTTVLAGPPVLLVAGVAPAQPSPPPERVRGDVISLKGNALEIRSRTGQTVHVDLADDSRVKAVIFRIDSPGGSPLKA